MAITTINSVIKEKEHKLTPAMIKKIESRAKEPDLTDPDAPEITGDQIARAIRRGRPLKQETTKPVSIRINERILAKLRASGKGWQTRLSAKISQLVKKGLL